MELFLNFRKKTFEIGSFFDIFQNVSNFESILKNSVRYFEKSVMVRLNVRIECWLVDFPKLRVKPKNSRI